MRKVIAVILILFIAGGISVVCIGFETMWEAINGVLIDFFQ